MRNGITIALILLALLGACTTSSGGTAQPNGQGERGDAGANKGM